MPSTEGELLESRRRELLLGGKLEAAELDARQARAEADSAKAETARAVAIAKESQVALEKIVCSRTWRWTQPLRDFAAWFRQKKTWHKKREAPQPKNTLESGSVMTPPVPALRDGTRPTPSELRKPKIGIAHSADRQFPSANCQLPIGNFSPLRILYIDDLPPHRDMGCGYPRSNTILNEIVSQGHRVTFISLAFPPAENDYRDIPREVEIIDGTQERERLHRELAPQSDLVFVSRPDNMERFLRGQPPDQAARKYRLVYDAEAIFCDRDRLRAQVHGEPPEPAKVSAAWSREVSLALSADAVTVVAPGELSRFEAGGVRNLRILGHALRPQPGQKPSPARKYFLFVGAMPGLENPNADSIHYFCREIWPRVHAMTGATLIIAGYGTEKTLAHFAAATIQVAGGKDDLTPLYDEARVFIVPTRYAAGIPYKAHEAAARGVPLVVSALIGEQLGWSAGSDLLAGSTAPEFAEQCIRLYHDEALWIRLRTNALQRVRQELNPVVFSQAIQDLLREAKENTPRIS